MKQLIILFIALFILGCVQQSPKVEGNMKLTSSAFENQGKIDSKYTCDGENINPFLSISDVPSNAKSLVLIMDDPDAIKPANKVWDHWIVWNIPADTTEIPEGEELGGIHGKGTGGNLDYVGPCPPDGEHRYFFKLYALDVVLELEQCSSKAELESAMQRHIIEKTQLMGRYSR